MENSENLFLNIGRFGGCQELDQIISSMPYCDDLTNPLKCYFTCYECPIDKKNCPIYNSNLE